MWRIVVALAALALTSCSTDADTGSAATSTAVSTQQASTKDANFIETLDRGHIPYQDGHDAILQGQAACVYLSPANGGTYLGAIQGVGAHEPGFTDEQRGFFIGAAVQILCPDEVSVLPTS
jgi:hypothetical protein